MIDCACGKIHESNWKEPVLELEDGTVIEAWILCEKHARHEPCRPCMAEEATERGFSNHLEMIRHDLKK